VYAAGQSPKQATSTSLVLVAMTAVVGIIPQWRAGRVRVAAGATFGLTGVGGSLLGSHWNKAADPNVLLLAFSGLMMLAAYGMWRGVRKPKTVPAPQPVTSMTMTIVKVVVAGTAVGLLTGLFGVGGGFVIVPALVLALGFAMPEAIGTSLLVITINSLIALTTRLPAGNIEWSTVIPFAGTSLVGIYVGHRLATSRDSSSLQRWFVGLLVVVAIYTAVHSGVALQRAD